MFTSCGTLAVMACYAVPLWICHLLRTLCGVNGVGLLGGKALYNILLRFIFLVLYYNTFL